MNDESRETKNLNLRPAKDPGSSPVGLQEARKDYAPGEVIGDRYEIKELLGRGATGAVYRVEQKFLKKQYALKVLSGLVHSANTLRRFQNEALAASRLDHPNIAKAVDYGLIGGNQPYFVMEIVEGETLAQLLKRSGRLPWEKAITIFRPILEALGHAHSQYIVHRDIKPGNIVLTKNVLGDPVHPKIVDFGIAKVEIDEDEIGSPLTRTGEVFGTPLYMSPEQCAGTRVDGRSDIYSLGCVLYETLTGSPPFHGDTALQLMMAHGMERPLTLKEASLGNDFPQSLEIIVTRMLEKFPKDRYEDCYQVANDLNLAATGKFKAPQRKDASKEKAGSGRTELKIALGVLAVAIGLFGATIWTLQSMTPAAGTRDSRPRPISIQNVTTSDRSQIRIRDGENEQALFEATDLTNPTSRNTFFHYVEHAAPRCTFPGPQNQLANDDLRVMHVGDFQDVSLDRQRYLGDDCVKYLLTQPIQHLAMEETKLTDKGLAQLVKGLAPTLEQLDLAHTHVSKIELLQGLPLLAKLKINDSIGIKTHLKSAPPLVSLTDLQANTVFDDGSIGYVAKLPILKRLTVVACNLHDAATVPALSRCKQLRDLDIHSNPGVTDKTLTALQSLPLDRVNLARTGVTADGVARLIRSVKTLSYVRVTENPKITPEQAQALNIRFDPRCRVE